MSSNKKNKKHKPLIAKASKNVAPYLSGLPSSLKGIFSQDYEKAVRVPIKPLHNFSVINPFETLNKEIISDSNSEENSNHSNSSKSESDFILKHKCDFLRSDDEIDDNIYSPLCVTPEIIESKEEKIIKKDK